MSKNYTRRPKLILVENQGIVEAHPKVKDNLDRAIRNKASKQRKGAR